MLEPPPGPTEQADDTLLLLFLCCHPALSPASAVALTLRAVGGLTTREIAEAYLVPEATMAQRISRAKRTVGGQPLGPPGDVAVVLRVLYLIFNEGYGGRVDLAAEAIRLTRQLMLECDEPEVAGLLALMLLHHARRAARTDEHGALVPLDRQDRQSVERAEIAEGVRILQAALARGPARRVPDPGGDRRAARRRAARGGDRLAADPRVVRRTRRAHRQPVRRAEPGRRGGRGGRPARRAARAGRSRRAATRTTTGSTPSGPTCTSGPATSTRRSSTTLRAAAHARSTAERDHLTKQAARLRAARR